VFEQEYERAVGYANTSLHLLKQSSIPPYPQFYELLYTYATGANSQLNNRINAAVRSGNPPSRALVEALYNEFFKSGVDDKISSVSERLHERIQAVYESIDTAMNQASAYSQSLSVASAHLEDSISAVELRRLAERLLAETQQMQQTNRRLEEKLEASREDIAALQRDLDNVRRSAMLDPLTKIANRRGFDDGLAAAIRNARTNNTPLSLILIDIDNFKAFNDSYGHQTGDQVLRLTATTIKGLIKRKDLAARYGGEEFVAVLESTTVAAAHVIAENIRKAIQAKKLFKRSTSEQLGRITASFGVAGLQPNDDAITLFERADRFLYAAKHAGRNCVISEREGEASTAA
jgi:diguanylate cyclase